MKKITFKRPNEEFNKNFAYINTIDGKNVAELQNGEVKTIEVSSDSKNQRLQSKLIWCGSKPISLANLPNAAVLTVGGMEFLIKKNAVNGSYASVDFNPMIWNDGASG